MSDTARWKIHQTAYGDTFEHEGEVRVTEAGVLVLDAERLIHGIPATLPCLFISPGNWVMAERLYP